MLEAISSEVSLAVRNRNEVDVDYLAIELSSRYPQSGLPIDAICGEIETSLKALDEMQ